MWKPVFEAVLQTMVLKKHENSHFFKSDVKIKIIQQHAFKSNESLHCILSQRKYIGIDIQKLSIEGAALLPQSQSILCFCCSDTDALF